MIRFFLCAKWAEREEQKYLTKNKEFLTALTADSLSKIRCNFPFF